MKTIEKTLEEYKQAVNKVQAPPGLEERLRNALERVPAKKRNTSKAWAWAVSTAAALILMLGVYEYPAFAYYGSKLFNGAGLNSLSFAEVMEQGFGQQVNKRTTLPDGAVLTIHGVIADDNVFRLYYNIDLPEGIEFTDDRIGRYHFDSVKGFLTDSAPLRGGGNPGKSKSQFAGYAEFEPVSPFSRTLTVTFSEWLDNGKKASYPITFDFEANKAMKSIVKEELSDSVNVDQGTIHYDYITASPTSTIVKGHYELEAYPRFSGKTRLYVNGIEVRLNEEKGQHPADFQLNFDPFPTRSIQSIELVLENFEGYHKINDPIPLGSPSDRSIKVGNEKFWIRSVTKTDAGYEIVIARNQFTFLDKGSLSVQAGGKIIPVSSISAERQWDLNNGNILWEQTYLFNTRDKPEFLLADGYQYIKNYKKKISIPVDRQK